MHRVFRRNPILTAAGVLLVAIGLAACGGSSSSSSSSSAAAAPSTATGSGTVSTQNISGAGTVLVDSKGNALYTNNRDSGSKVACTGSCASVWVPLAAPSSGKPTSSDSSVQAKLGVVMTPDGTSQVTWGGKPLYTFVSDSAGQVTGNGVTDSFNGTSFTWTVASTGKTSGSSASTTGANSASTGTSATGGSAPAASTGSSSGGGGGGYGY
jgi:predicted lipoprotein with Yx(FWY)xxD motif